MGNAFTPDTGMATTAVLSTIIVGTVTATGIIENTTNRRSG
jgi:hypothetical protein